MNKKFVVRLSDEEGGICQERPRNRSPWSLTSATVLIAINPQHRSDNNNKGAATMTPFGAPCGAENCPTCRSLVTFFVHDVGSTIECQICGAALNVEPQGLRLLVSGKVPQAPPSPETVDVRFLGERPWSSPPPASTEKPPPFEFTPEQKTLIASLVFYMQCFGVVGLIVGALLVVVSLVAIVLAMWAPMAQLNVMNVVILSMVQAAVALLVGGFAFTAGGAFRQIGNPKHLMAALKALRTFFQLQLIIFCIGVGVGLLVPAVQKVREAAEKTQKVPGAQPGPPPPKFRAP